MWCANNMYGSCRVNRVREWVRVGGEKNLEPFCASKMATCSNECEVNAST